MKKIFLILISFLAIKTYSQEYKRLYLIGIVKEGKFKVYVESIDVFSKSIELNSNHEDNETLADTYYHRGICKENLKYYKEAIIDFTKAIEINDKNLDYYFHRGAAKNLAGIDDISDLNHCILGNRKDVKENAYLFRGFYYLEANQNAQACSDWNEALKLGNVKAKGFIEKYCN